jgi:hypothetical protein
MMDEKKEPDPLIYLLAQLSLFVFPTARALKYVEWTDQWRRENHGSAPTGRK